MDLYYYNAKDLSGKSIKDSLQAESKLAAIALLRQNGLYVINIEEEKGFNKLFRKLFSSDYSLSLKSREIFSRQLATLLKSGMHLRTALSTMVKQTENEKHKQLFEHLVVDVDNANSLSGAMKKYPKAFPPVYVAIIQSSEQTGGLAEALNSMSKQLKTQLIVKSKIQSALAYPLFLLVIGIAIIGILMTFVIPKFIELFVNAKKDLPMPTAILLWLTNFVKENYFFVALVIACCGSFIYIALKQDAFRLYFDRIVFRFPIVGKVILKTNIARFARVLSSLISGGVIITSALQIVCNTTKNIAFATDIISVNEDLKNGESLSESLSKLSTFDSVIVNMISVGEKSGALPEMLTEVADIYDDESESTIQNLTNLLGPVLIVTLGLIIGFVVMAILLPVFESSTMIS